MMQAAYREPLLDNGEVGLLSKFTSAEYCIWIVRLAWREAIYCSDSRDISFEPVFSASIRGYGVKVRKHSHEDGMLELLSRPTFFPSWGTKETVFTAGKRK